MAAIPGHVRDEVIIIGCHRDGVCCLTNRDPFTNLIFSLGYGSG